MQFSVQQLQGGMQYGPRTRVGNWFEDIVLQEERYAEFRKKKESGKLAIGFRSRRFNICCQKVPHSYSADGKLRFGDTVIIYNQHLKATLANDPFEEMALNTNRLMVTATPAEVGPTARTTFVITRVPASLQDPLVNKYADDSVLHYGQPFQLAANPSIRVDDVTGVLQQPLFLASQLKTERAASKWSNRQAVYMTDVNGYDTVWKAYAPAEGKFDGVRRQFSESEAVSSNAPLVITHKATNKPLALDPKYGESTDFGGEYEVTAHSFTSLGKNEMAAAELRGTATAGSITKPELPQNIWVIKTATDPKDAKDDRVLPPLATPEVILGVVKKHLKELGLGVSAVRAKIPRKLPKVSVEDAKWVLKELAVPVSEGYLSLWVDTLDRLKEGMVSVKEFVGHLRGTACWSTARQEAVDAAFAAIGGTPKGAPAPALPALKRLKISAHPKVAANVVLPESALAELKELVVSKLKAEHIMAYDDFVEYYKDLSCEVESDDAFTATVKDLWSL